MVQPMRWPKLFLVLGVSTGITACGILSQQCSTLASPTDIPPGERLSATQLKYLLMEEYGQPFFCDPDFYPVSRGDEQQKALEWFAQADLASEEIRSILEKLGLQAPSLSDEQKLLVYREHKLLGSILLTPSGEQYRFDIRTGGEPEGESVSGLIDDRGRIDAEQREPSFNTCPICLAGGALIDRPEGPRPVQELQPGMVVWTMDLSGARVAAVILRSRSVPVPDGFTLVQLVLIDGRELLASPGHPLADGRWLGDIVVGDVVDGALVVQAERIQAAGSATYDLLPAGDTGLYWANGILVRSTLIGPEPEQDTRRVVCSRAVHVLAANPCPSTSPATPGQWFLPRGSEIPPHGGGN